MLTVSFSGCFATMAWWMEPWYHCLHFEMLTALLAHTFTTTARCTDAQYLHLHDHLPNNPLLWRPDVQTLNTIGFMTTFLHKPSLWQQDVWMFNIFISMTTSLTQPFTLMIWRTDASYYCLHDHVLLCYKGMTYRHLITSFNPLLQGHDVQTIDTSVCMTASLKLQSITMTWQTDAQY